MARRSWLKRAAATAAIGLAALASSANGYSEKSREGSLPNARAANIQLVFFEFYDRPASLFVNGIAVQEGVLKVVDESTGLSHISRIEAGGPTTFRLKSGALDTTVEIEITPDIKTIMINPYVPPHIWGTKTDSTLLD